MNDNAIPTPAIPTPGIPTPAIPASMCDIVLKGGLTSGVVYPLALARLAKNFRFSNIGGTSAGAIAAAAAAAAEYGRQTRGGLGFARLEKIPEEIGPHLLALFQPTPALKPVYDTFIALLNALPALAPIAAPVTRYWGTALLGLLPGFVIFLFGVAANSCGCALLGVVVTLLGPVVVLVARMMLAQPTPLAKSAQDTLTAVWDARADIPKVLAVKWTPLKGYWGTAAVGLVPAILILLCARTCGWVAFGLLVALLGLIGAIVGRFLYAAGVELVNNDYGLCPGIRQPYSSDEAFTDWLTRLIDEAAGRSKGQDPLTFGDLANLPGGKINLAMMTTSLMEERPYTLPMLGSHHATAATNPPPAAGATAAGEHHMFVFKRSEWEKLFPARVMKYLLRNCPRLAPPPEESGEFYYFPDEAHLPLVVATRMSLSFPGLICAVPLWRHDFTLKADEQKKLQRCLFSDGGLSSNFPIHFFDHLLPNHPTFAITLDEWDDRRNRDAVWLPSTKYVGSGSSIPILPFSGLPDFLYRLVNSAKDWQDSLQSVLPGYRERIVHVVLKPDEGGINLNMDAATVTKLADYGEQAGDILCKQFDLNAHRWRRFLVAMARMEETLDEMGSSYYSVTGGTEDFEDFLKRYPQVAEHYKQKPDVLAAMLARGKELADAGTAWRTPPCIRDGSIPQPPTNLRITPKP
jgi:predicted acylesterase/phospholipase RssA